MIILYPCKFGEIPLTDSKDIVGTRGRQTVQGQQYFPFYQHFCSKLDDSQISKSLICLTHLSRMDSSILIIWKSPFFILGVLGLFFSSLV